MPDQGPHIDNLRREAQARIVVASQILDHLLSDDHNAELTDAQRLALHAARQRTVDAVNDLEHFPSPAILADGEPAILRMAAEIAGAVPPDDDDEALA
jgi:hypothetical protein